MSRNLISASLLAFALQGCSDRPAGFQGALSSVAAQAGAEDGVGQHSSRDSISSDAVVRADASKNYDGIDSQIIETQATEIEASSISSGLDATVSIPNSSDQNNNSAGPGSTGPIAASSETSATSDSVAGGMTNTGDNSPMLPADSSTSTTSANSTSATNAPIAVPITLTIAVSSDQVRSGSNILQATAAISTGPGTPAAVQWSVKASGSSDPGTISDAGLYTSPASSNGYDVTLTAVLLDDSSVSDSVLIKIVAPEQIFVGCQSGNNSFPIVADVYQLAANTKFLPDFSTIGLKQTTVCMDQYNVAARNWSNGFPGVTGLFEWFALKTSTHLAIASTGSYAFKLNSDDGAKLYIDGVLVINNDGQHAPTAKEATITLSAGDHLLTLDYFQGPRYQIALELFWKTPGTSSYVYVPREVFK